MHCSERSDHGIGDILVLAGLLAGGKEPDFMGVVSRSLNRSAASGKRSNQTAVFLTGEADRKLLSAGASGFLPNILVDCDAAGGTPEADYEQGA